MRRPLIKSIQKGYLLDQKYWARRSREGTIEPVYFSSAIAKNELSRLDGLLRHLGGDSHLHMSDEDEFGEDSDYDSDPEPISDPTSGNAEVDREKERGQKLLPLLTVGSPVA